MNTFITTLKSTTLLVFVVLSGCSTQQSGEHSHDEHTQEEEHAQETMTVELSALQIETVGIRTGRFSRLPLQNSVKANGILELPPQNKAEVSALVTGAIRTINVIEGDRVEKGEVLALLEDPHIVDMQQDYVDKNERLRYLEHEYERSERLLEQDLISISEYDRSSSEYQSIRARTAALKGKLELLGLDPNEALNGNIRSAVPIRAPLGGYVRLVEVNTGSYVTPGRHLFEIVDNHHIHIGLMVYEKDLHRVRNDQVVRFRYTNQPDDMLYRARIFAVGKAFEQEPKAVRVHAELTEEQSDLLPGMYVEAWIVTDSSEVMALPEGAVVSDGGSSYIFIKEEQEQSTIQRAADTDAHGSHFRAVEVTTGASDNGFVEIKLLEDLSEETEVVTKGAFFILSEMKKGEGEHHH
jgi:cobalt-zinc-cadmium efflux system membrane fusion protein